MGKKYSKRNSYGEKIEGDKMRERKREIGREIECEKERKREREGESELVNKDLC